MLIYSCVNVLKSVNEVLESLLSDESCPIFKYGPSLVSEEKWRKSRSNKKGHEPWCGQFSTLESFIALFHVIGYIKKNRMCHGKGSILHARFKKIIRDTSNNNYLS